jgi:PAS domain S-box-containing protein
MTAEAPDAAPSQLAEAGRPKRALVLPILLLVLLAAMTAFLAFDHLHGTQENRVWVRHSRDIIDTTQTLYSALQELESDQRGYMLSGDTRTLKTFEASRAAVPTALKNLRTMVEDNPAQVARVDRLTEAARERVAVSVMRVQLYREGRIDEAKSVKPNSGLNAMDQIRTEVSEITRDESLLLEHRRAEANRDDLIGFLTALALSAVAVIGLGVLVISMAVTNRRLSHEIAERQAAENAQRESEARYRAIFANTADLLSVIDLGADGVFRMAEVNPAYEAATGSSTLQLRGLEVAYMSAESKLLVEYLKAVVASGQPSFTRDRVTIQGQRRVWESILVPVRNGQGQIDRVLGSSRDVTERENAQEQLRRAQRMEAVGHLTGGVAHDFNNLLQVIRGNLELLAGLVEADEAASQRVKNALHGANRAAQLTRQLLAFARRQPLEPKVVNLGRMVGDMAEMLRRTLGESVEVETVIGGGLWNTLCDPAQVESAILNLAINARDAMPKGGRLTIELSNASLDDAYARSVEVDPGQFVQLAVSDTGQGMDAATLSKVFEPFFTTKSVEKGTGLGLSMVYGFVKQSNGAVQIYSEPGQGTTVKIYLPRSREREPAYEAPVSGTLRGRSEVILVVEDDDMVRASAVGMLRDLGYACVHANDGDSALEMIKSGVKFDLLFTDVIMPGSVKSRELANEAERLRPGLPVLFTSGYTDNAIIHHGRLDEGVHLLSKPYSREDLARKIRGLLKETRRVVLVVEDDPLVRMSAVDMIEALGFTALQAEDGPSALAIVDSDQKIDVLFTDVGLPGMRGHEVAREALKRRSELKVVFASGYGEADGAGPAGATHLGKPYEQDELAEALGMEEG